MENRQRGVIHRLPYLRAHQRFRPAQPSRVWHRCAFPGECCRATRVAKNTGAACSGPMTPRPSPCPAPDRSPCRDRRVRPNRPAASPSRGSCRPWRSKTPPGTRQRVATRGRVRSWHGRAPRPRSRRRQLPCAPRPAGRRLTRRRVRITNARDRGPVRDENADADAQTPQTAVLPLRSLTLIAKPAVVRAQWRG
jgi:hypothetical protein